MDEFQEIKIPELIPANELKDSAEYPISQEGVTYRVKQSAIEGKIISKIDARYISSEQKGAANGVAPLGSDRKIPNENLNINVPGGVTGYEPIGKVEEGDKRAVSGDEVHKEVYSSIISISEENGLIFNSSNKADNLIKGFVRSDNSNGAPTSTLSVCQFDIPVTEGVYLFKGKRVNRSSDLQAISVLGKRVDGSFQILLNGITTGYEEVGHEISIEIPITNKIVSVSVSYLATSDNPSFLKINGYDDNIKDSINGFKYFDKNILIDKFRLNASNGGWTLTEALVSSAFTPLMGAKYIETTLPVATSTNLNGIIFYDENYSFISGVYNNNFRYTDLLKKINVPSNAVSFKTCFNNNILNSFVCKLLFTDLIDFNDVVKENENKAGNLIKGYVTEINTNGNPNTGNHVCQFNIPVNEGDKYLYNGIIPIAVVLTSISALLGIKSDGTFIELIDAYVAANPKNGSREELIVYIPKDVINVSVTFNNKSVNPAFSKYEINESLSDILSNIDTPINENEFKGLKVLTFGSSNLTDNAGTWSQDLCTDLEMERMTMSVGSSKYAYFPQYNKKSVVEQVEDFIALNSEFVPDIIFLSTGLNDSWHAPITPIGDWNIVQDKSITEIRQLENDNSFGISTFYGSLKYVIETLQDKFENCLIIMNIPFQVWKTRADGFNPYVNPLKIVANYYSVPIINSWEEGGIIRKYEYLNVMGRYTVDGVHVKSGSVYNDKGRELQRSFMLSRFRQIYYKK